MKHLRVGVPISLLAFILAAAPISLFAQGRVLKVKVVADEAFREKKDWEKEIQEHFIWADKEFRKMTGMGLQVVAVDRWTTHQADDMSLLFNELRVRVEKGAEADIVVGLTGHEAPQITFFTGGGGGDWGDIEEMGRPSTVRIVLPHTLGLTLPFSDRVVVRRSDDKKETRHTLLHEVAHLFGGLHVKEKSILYTVAGPQDFVLDPFNKRVVEMMRDRDFNQSIEEMPAEQLDALIKVYRERPLRDERDFENNIRVGYLMLVRGEVDDAVKEFERAIEIDPSATNSLLRGLVIPELETHFEEHRGSVEGRYMLGRAYATVKEWGKAAAQFQPNCYGPTPHAESCANLGGVLLQAMQFEASERALRRAVELEESSLNAHNNLGILCSMSGRTDEAIAHFNRALELKPDDPQVYYNMGMGYLNLGQFDPAVNSLRRAVALAPKNNDNQTKLAVALARQGNAKEALQLVKKVEASKETLDFGFVRFEMMVLSAHGYRDIAEVYFRSGDAKKAWKYLAEAKKKGVNVTELEQQMASGAPAAAPRRAKTDDLLEQGRAYYGEERYELARQQLEQARAQDPKEEEVHYWLGRVASKQGKKDEARQSFQQALALKEKYPDPYLELARLAVDNEDYAGAMPHLRRYTELSPDGSEGQFLMGLCQYHLEDLASAEKALREAIRSESDYGDAFYILGRVYQKLQRNADALAELQLAVDSRTLSSRWRPEAHYQLARLLREAGKNDLAYKQARLAERYGYAGADELVEEMEGAEPDLAERAEDGPSDRPGPVAFSLEPAPQGQLYELQRAQLGDPPGTVRAGQFNLGRIRLVRRGMVGGQVAILMRIWQPPLVQTANWVLFFAQVPVGEGEIEFDFRFLIPPNAVSKEGSYQAAVSVTTPPVQGAMPKALSNEVEVPFRLVP